MRKLIVLSLLTLPSFPIFALDLDKADKSISCMNQAGVIALSFERSLNDKEKAAIWTQKHVDHYRQAVNYGLSPDVVIDTFQRHVSGKLMFLDGRVRKSDFSLETPRSIQNDISHYNKRRGLLTQSCASAETLDPLKS
ncbi:hypothetical protein KP803_00685 [Vibrio sp. ZSDE26]|uniref:Uncharacterized protein n=1 Tax=Vibrio amylolyticus TaxID=2847292 RepID=A0A9X1XHC5_9VIBR|nr:hypothetical protein [Vibrio amylolyticus]MCK6261783.1 hypothetical protein [Vibrio amylolyticus]